VSTTIVLLHDKNDTMELHAWEWLLTVLKRLGPDGMSSEDTEVESALETVYRVRVLEWRRNIDREMTVIDNMRYDNTDIYAPQGSKPGRRVRGNGLKSNRDPVCHLPLPLYDQDWYMGVSTDFKDTVLCVSKDQFQWLSLRLQEL
jgi:hypothetical protein